MAGVLYPRWFGLSLDSIFDGPRRAAGFVPAERGFLKNGFFRFHSSIGSRRPTGDSHPRLAFGRQNRI